MAQIDKPNLHFNTKLYTGTWYFTINYWCWFSTRFSLVKNSNTSIL